MVIYGFVFVNFFFNNKIIDGGGDFFLSVLGFNGMLAVGVGLGFRGVFSLRGISAVVVRVRS